MENSTPNIKNNTLYNDYKDCGLWVKKRRYLKKSSVFIDNNTI